MRRFEERSSQADAAVVALALSASTVLGLVVVRQGPSLGVAFAGILGLAALAATFPRRIVLAAGCVGLMLGAPGRLALSPSPAKVWQFSLVLALGYLAVSLLRNDRGGLRRLRWTTPDVVLAAYMTVVVLSWVVRAPDQSWTVVLSVIGPICIYAMARTIPGSQVRSVLWVALVAAAVGAVTIFIEAFEGRVIFGGTDPNTYGWAASGVNAFRASGIFGSPPVAAAVLFSTALACYPLYFSLTKLQSTAARLLGAACAVGALLAFTRAPTIGFLIGVGLIVLVRAKSTREMRNHAFTIGLAALMLLQFAPAIDAGFARSNDTLAQRQGFWGASVPLITDSPQSVVLGHGPLNLVTRLQSGQSIPAAMGISELASWSVHNYFIQTAIDAGLPGLALVLAWILAILISALSETFRTRRVRPPPGSSGLGPAVVVFTAGLLTSAYTTPGAIFPLALWAGLAVSARQRSQPTAAPNAG